jgi:hypothetical protein
VSSVKGSLLPRAIREHIYYLVGLALFAGAVVLPAPHFVRIALGILGLLLLVVEALRYALQIQDPEPQQGKSRCSGMFGPGSWLMRHRRLVQAVCFVAAILASAYLWAVVFGDGIPGLKGVAELDRSSSYPDADAVLVGAVALWCIASLLAALSSTYTRVWKHPVRNWTGGTLLSGLLAFGVSRIFT